MDGARPSSGAATTSRGPGGNRHPGGIAESRAHDARTLSTMDGTLRDSCERIRDRVAELAGDARPRVVSSFERPRVEHVRGVREAMQFFEGRGPRIGESQGQREARRARIQ